MPDTRPSRVHVSTATIGLPLPATRSEAIRHVTALGGQPQILDALRLLPERCFENYTDLCAELRAAMGR